jgi:septal ring factor EnvC (AmiA/AmiB activator)
VKEITTSHERVVETLWNAWKKEQQALKQMIEGQEKAIKQLQQDIQGIQTQATEERKLMQEQIDELKRCGSTPHAILSPRKCMPLKRSNASMEN